MSPIWNTMLSQAATTTGPVMTPLLWVTLAAAGGLGAVARRQSDLLLTRIEHTRPRRIPMRTMLINILACLALGLLTGAALSHELLAVLGTGFLGGYSTFSTAMGESAKLLNEPDTNASRSIIHALAMLLLSLLAAAFGLILGSTFAA